MVDSVETRRVQVVDFVVAEIRNFDVDVATHLAVDTVTAVDIVEAFVVVTAVIAVGDTCFDENFAQ